MDELCDFVLTLLIKMNKFQVTISGEVLHK